MKIHYEKHPVSRERKAELRAQGFKIIDSRFQPAQPAQPDEAEIPAVEADAGNVAPADDGAPAVSEPAVTIKHKGGGSYAVLIGEDVIASGLSKAEAEARAAAVEAE